MQQQFSLDIKVQIINARKSVLEKMRADRNRVDFCLASTACPANAELIRQTRKWIIGCLSIEIAALNTMNEYRDEFKRQHKECMDMILTLVNDVIALDGKLKECNKVEVKVK